MVKRAYVWSVPMIFMVLFASGSAFGELNLKEGMWRLELSGLTGVYSGSTDRGGDFTLTGAVEYEIPAGTRTTLGLRLLPLFLYDGQEVDREFWRCERDDADTVWGGGVGVAGRIYTKAEEYRGFFLEGTANALGHDGKIAGNSANLNFLLSIGGGYQWKCGASVAVRYEHISNAGLANDNDGANSVGLALGYRF